MDNRDSDDDQLIVTFGAVETFQKEGGSEAQSGKKSQVKSIVFALIGGFFFAVANCIVAVFSPKYGARSFTTFWFGSLVLWAFYHIFHKVRKTPEYQGIAIYHDELGKLSCMRLFTQVIRVVVELISHVLMILTYQFYGMSGS